MTDYNDPTYLEDVYAALFTLLKAAPFPAGITWKKTARMVTVPDNVSAVEQPALFLYQGPVSFSQKEMFGPIKNDMTAIAIVYVRAEGSASDSVATQLNLILWAIKRSFDTRPPYQKQTLGGLVHHARIEGDVGVEYLDQQVVITVPIHIYPN